MRPRHRRPTVACEGDTVIDGRLRARLLGLPLLEIDAHVVVGPAHPHRIAATQRREPSRRPLATNGSAQPPLSQAVRLLAEGTSTLDDARRIRRLATES